MRVDAARGLHSDHLAAEVPRAEDELRRDEAFREDPLLHVEVGEEAVERRDPLLEAVLDVCPLLGRDDPRDEVEREDPVGSLVFAVDREADPWVRKNALAVRIRSRSPSSVSAPSRSFSSR